MPKRPIAAFTICQNEPVFLPLWLRHYGCHFDPGDVYVLDHLLPDGPGADVAPAQGRVIPLHLAQTFHHHWLRDTVCLFQRFLLQSYDAVLFAEVDELVVPDPTRYPGGLGEYAARNPDPVVRCRGLNVWHDRAVEPPIDWARPVTLQRRWAYESTFYCKPLLARRPVDWSLGFHDCAGPDVRADPDLYLVHLHRADYASCHARHAEVAARRWRQEDVDAGLGRQNRIHEPEAFDRWFDTEDMGPPWVEIPACLKGVV